MNWPFAIRCFGFFWIAGGVSVAITYSTVGFSLATWADVGKVAALFFLAGIAGVKIYRVDPEGAWKTLVPFVGGK